MSEAKEIYCSDCGCYCGKIHKASLIKALTYTCGTCHNKRNKKSGFDLFNDLFSSKGKNGTF